MELEARGEVFQWRGPAPYYYVAVPDAEAERIAAVAPLVTYGWGVIPVTGRLGATTFTTSLFPKDGGYLVPLKDAVRRPEGVDDGDEVVVLLTLDGV
ncbi:DUF1905 domain-containing protein [Isoptericola sp. NPDC057391]|uniref:DUF1905 domain-containing protein n=1 Tax=Isoptericola sp. NPDC057391 TaxID=3346117 RepID=UPI00363F211D